MIVSLKVLLGVVAQRGCVITLPHLHPRFDFQHQEPAQPSQNKGRGPSTTEQSKIGDDRRESDAAAAEGRAEDDAEAEDKKGNKVGNKKSATKAGGGSKASAKKAAAAKLSKGKQSSMMSFFKKI